MVQRRRVVTLLVTLALPMLSQSAAAQEPRAGRVVRIGYFTSVASAPGGDLAKLQQALRELGWSEGRNLVFEFRSAAESASRLRELAAELVRLKVDLIFVAGSSAAVLAAKQATTRIPIVFRTPADPLEAGLVTNLARPGGNVTGFGGAVPAPKRLELLHELLPAVTRVAVLWNPTNPSHPPALKELEVPARAMGVQLHAVEVAQRNQFDGAFAALERKRAEALVVLGDVVFISNVERIVALAAKARLPAIYIWRRAVEVGGLVSYGEDSSDVPLRAAVYIDRILKGAKPGDLPVERPTKFELVINLKTARALGLTIPPSVLLRADQVIE